MSAVPCISNEFATAKSICSWLETHCNFDLVFVMGNAIPMKTLLIFFFMVSLRFWQMLLEVEVLFHSGYYFT